MSNVQRINITSPPTSLAFWTDILGHCPNLRYIKLSHGDMPELASILSLGPRDGTENQGELADRGQRWIRAPALEELNLLGIVFRTRTGTDIDPLEDTSVQSLCDALSTRKQPRGRLIMTQCNEFIDGNQLQRFDMEGWWGGGRFCTVSWENRDYP